MDMKQTNQIPGLYDPSFEHDNCGIGACVNIKGVKNHQTVDNALKIVETLEHRAECNIILSSSVRIELTLRYS